MRIVGGFPIRRIRRRNQKLIASVCGSKTGAQFKSGTAFCSRMAACADCADAGLEAELDTMTMSITYFHHPDAPAGAPPLAARAGDHVFVGGQMAVHPVEGIPAEAKLLPDYYWHGSSIHKQLTFIYRNLDETLKQLGSSLPRCLKINSYHTDPAEVDMALRVRREWFEAEGAPPSSLLIVPELPVHGASVCLDMTNLAADAELDRELVQIRSVQPIGQVAAIGWPVYSQAVRGGGLVFTRGTTATGPRGPIDEIVPHEELAYRHNPVRFQTEYVLGYLKKLLADAGCTLEDVARAEIYLVDMADYAVFDEVWSKYFPVDPPARVVIQSPLAVPHTVVEVELVAVDPNGPYRKEIIATDDAPNPLGPEPQAVKAGPYLFLSSLMATDYRSGVPAEARPDPNFPYHTSGIRLQTEYILKNAEAICRSAGTSIRNLVKRRAIHTDLNDYQEAEESWRGAIGDRIPPTTCFRTDGPLAVPGCTVMYDLTAYIGE